MPQSSARAAPLLFMIFAMSALLLAFFAYPFYQPAALVGGSVFVLFALLAAYRPYLALSLWLFCLPWLSFAKWTGGMIVEEFDLALWGYMSGLMVYLLRHGIRAGQQQIKWRALLLLLTLVATLWQLALLLKGYQLLPAASSAFFTNYEDQGGALRLAKAFISALCFYVCCRYLSYDWPRFERALTDGFALGALAVIAGCLYERWYFTGLLNLTTDYRTTAWFWEMHTGGATLDAYLALSLPFILLGLFYSKAPVKKLAYALLLAAYGYVALTTFSRGVYIALPLVTILFFMRHYQAMHGVGSALLQQQRRRLLLLFMLSVLALIASLLLFDAGGYRVLLAIAGLSLLLQLVVSQPRHISVPSVLTGFVVAGLIGAAVYVFIGMGRSVYLLYALCWLAALGLLLARSRLKPAAVIDVCLSGALLLQALLTAAVCWYWSDYSLTWQHVPALTLVLLMLLSLLVPAGTATSLPLFVSGASWLLGSAMSLALVMFLNSSYIDSRFATTDQDLSGRFQHWQKALNAMPEPADLWLGSGVGRFVSLNRQSADPDDQVAELRLLPTQQGNVLYMKSGLHVQGYGEMFRLTQQISRPVGDITLRLTLRHSSDVQLAVEICDKQLLYHALCARGGLVQKGASNGARQYTVNFSDNPFTLTGGNPLHKTFSVALSNRDTELVIESMQLSDSVSANLLSNSDFGQGMQNWFFSSDRHHMPYHIKGLWPMQLFEMGLIGLALWTLLTVLVCLRQLVAGAGFSLSGSAVALAVIGMLFVGLFDSVIDSGRMSMLYLILLLLGASITPPRAQPLSPL